MGTFSSRLGKVLATPFLLVPLALASCGSSAQSEANSKKLSPATTEEIFLYRGIGASYLCNARSAGIEFPKAVGIAAATYAQVLNGRHGGFVVSAGEEKLTNKQLFSGAEFQIVTGALQYCPKQVPDDVKEKVQDALRKQNEGGKL